MSITAFPVMARILKDRGMTQTRLGRLALSSAAIADVFAWIMLAVVVALIGAGSGGLVRTTVGMLRARRARVRRVAPVLSRGCCARFAPTGEPSQMLLAALLIGAARRARR